MTDNFETAALDRIIAACGTAAEALVPILLAIQDEYRYLPPESLRLLCEKTAISPADLAGVVSFFPRFRTRPAGRHLIQVCVGTACHVRGALDTAAEFRHQLGIEAGGDTDGEGLFTIEEVACLGCCMLAPAVRIGDCTYGRVEAGRVPDVLADFLKSSSAQEGETGGLPSPAAVDAGRRQGEVRICSCTSCLSAGAAPVAAELVRQIRELSLPAAVRNVSCTGRSSEAPLVDVVLDGGHSWRYGRIGADQVRPLLLEHFRPEPLIARAGAAAARLMDRLLTVEEDDPVIRYRLGEGTAGGSGIESRQVRIATCHGGEVDPLDLDAYEKRGGFVALRRVLEELQAGEVVDMIAASGLRGRGGGGYPAAAKWRAVMEAPSPVWVICNGDEGDPGAFMDRMILESFPFRVIEGMAIAAATVGAEEGFFYIRGEYTQALARLREAIGICTRQGRIGSSPFGSGRLVQLRVFEGAGAFVCGEETALMEAMEGRRAMPRFRPPFPSEEGLRGRPTLVNNVETLALVPSIIGDGPEAFAALGSSSSPGTKTFALAGRIRHGGLVEVPMGISVGDIVTEIGGGVSGGGDLKAVQIGGPAGGCIPASLAGTPVDYEALQEAGAVMGSGGMIVLGDRDCMVDLARYFAAFARRESCGKCGACRIGTARMLSLLENICAGRGREQDMTRLKEIGGHLRAASVCGLGRTAPNTLLSTLRHFPEEYRAHLEGRCPAGRCKALIRYSINAHCIGCTRCAQRCPSNAISVDPYEVHRIDDEACTRCDICRQVCPVDAVEVR